MLDPLPMHGSCKRCQGTSLNPPGEVGEHTWLYCNECGEPATTWGAYKAEALEIARLKLRATKPSGERRAYR